MSCYSWQLFCLLTFSIILVVSADASSVDYETNMAVEEVGRLFNYLFPIVPDKAQYIWRSSSLGGSVLVGREPYSNSLGMNRRVMPLKRAESECVKRCVEQGKLHPIQCLTLC